MRSTFQTSGYLVRELDNNKMYDFPNSIMPLFELSTYKFYYIDSRDDNYAANDLPFIKNIEATCLETAIKKLYSDVDYHVLYNKIIKIEQLWN